MTDINVWPYLMCYLVGVIPILAGRGLYRSTIDQMEFLRSTLMSGDDSSSSPVTATVTLSIGPMSTTLRGDRGMLVWVLGEPFLLFRRFVDELFLRVYLGMALSTLGVFGLLTRIGIQARSDLSVVLSCFGGAVCLGATLFFSLKLKRFEKSQIIIEPTHHGDLD